VLFVLVGWVGSVHWTMRIGSVRSIVVDVTRAAFIGIDTRSFTQRTPFAAQFEVDRCTFGMPLRWWPILDWYLAFTSGTVQVALWPVVLALSVVALWLWCIDRRHAPGHCYACGYERTGNESGVYPECGAATQCRTRCPQTIRGRMSSG